MNGDPLAAFELEQAKSDALSPPYAYAGPVARAIMRAAPEDFIVEEIPIVEPDGAGEHVWLHIRKRNTNTEWLGRQIARLAEVRPMDVGFAGLKDRNAVTSQWFSVYLAAKAEPDWSQLANEEIEILTVTRHSRKLRRGGLKGNRFLLTLREIDGDIAQIEQRLELIAERGVPNYFGPQRFGHDGENLQAAAEMFAGVRRKQKRDKRSIYLSAARSMLFNRVLGKRVSDASWDKILPGEVCVLDGRRGSFSAEAGDAELGARLSAGEIHPSAPLWGRGNSHVASEVAVLESNVLETSGAWRDGLELAGLDMERRASRLMLRDAAWQAQARELSLSFSLNAGSYATAVVREVFDVSS